MNEKGITTVLIFLAGVLILSLAIIGGSFYIKNKLQSTIKYSVNQKEESNKPVTPNKSVYTAFVKQEDLLGGGKVEIYDLTNQKLSNLDPELEKESKDNNPLPTIGEWSLDGRYIPIRFVRQAGTPNPLYFYDIETNKAIKLLNTVDGTPFYPSTFPILGASWTPENVLTYNGVDEQTGSEVTGLIDLTGKITTTPKSLRKIMWASDLRVTLSSNPQIGTLYTSISYKNKPIDLDIKKGAEIVGAINDMLIVLDAPKSPSLQSLTTSNLELDNAIKNAKNEEEVSNILKSYYMPKGDAYIQIYSLNDGKLMNTITIKNDGYLVQNAQIRPTKDTIIIQEKDEPFKKTFNAKYIEIDPQSGSQKNLFQEKANLEFITSYEITQDGQWLVFYKPSQKKNQLGEPLSDINAWNFDTGDKVVLCQSICQSLQVYNPKKFRIM